MNPKTLNPHVAVGSRRVVFQPYRREQLQAIVSQRLVDAGVAQAFDQNAIKYAASKVDTPLLSPIAGKLFWQIEQHVTIISCRPFPLQRDSHRIP